MHDHDTYRQVEERFFVPQTTTSIISMPDCGSRSHNLRSLLEMCNCSVHLHMIGTPGDFLAVIGQRYAPRFLFIVGHGTPDGLWFGNYGAGIDTSMLVDECLPPEMIGQHLCLPDCNVIGDYCHSGTDRMMRAFKQSPVRSYLGFAYAPSAELNLFLVNFIFRVANRGMAQPVAISEAIHATDHKELEESYRFHENRVEPTSAGDVATRAAPEK